MAISPSHQFGQIIGIVLEDTIEPLLSDFANAYDLYLDKKGERIARKGKKVRWTDLNGNRHDLDFVLEAEGTSETIGKPVAFIETAWRRYTKHSRNKAQEIQGAILPLSATYKPSNPFLGVVLAGVFTSGAITQLESLGFKVLLFQYNQILQAFKIVNIDANYDETTSDEEFNKKIRAWESLSANDRKRISENLISINHRQIETFFKDLERSVTRKITSVIVIPLHGYVKEFTSIHEAVNFLTSHLTVSDNLPLVSIQVEIHYNNGESLEGKYNSKETAIDFLRNFIGYETKGWG